MDTVSHGLWTYLLTIRHEKRWLPVAGAVAPDIALITIGIVYLLSGNYRRGLSLTAQLYRLPFIPLVDTVMHSVILWTLVLGILYYLHLEYAKWFVYGVYFHIAIDIVTHRSFLPRYFWPLSDLGVPGLVEYRTLSFTISDILLLLGFAALVWYRELRMNR